MAKILIVYSQKSGNTELMAFAIGQGVKAAHVEAVVQKVSDTTPDDLLEADAIILGSPTYYGSPSAEIKQLIDQSAVHHGKLNGKVGGAFTSSSNIGGGNETTILSLLQAMLVHGMIIQGSVTGNHYGPVSINKPDQNTRKQCHDYGLNIAHLTKRIVKQQEVPTL